MRILSSVRLTQYKPCYNSNSPIICVQNSIFTIIFYNIFLIYCFDNILNKCNLYYRHAATAPNKYKGISHLFLYVLLTLHLSIFISVINQLDAQTFCSTINLFHASTCFEHMCSSSGGQNCITQPLVSSHL